MARVLVTGLNGFMGPYLAAALVERGHEVVGTVLGPTAPHPVAVAARTIEVDVRDAAALTRVLEEVQPEGIIHLAALAAVGASFSRPALTFDVNLTGTLNLLEAMRMGRDAGTLPGAARCVLIGSADMYGRVRPDDLPVTEDAPVRPVSPYAVSKAAADLLAFQYHDSYGLDVIRLRPFNHTGPGQALGFVCSDFARQVAEAERDPAARRMRVGNLSPLRDFTDVRDMARAYALAFERGEGGAAYNVCSGRPRSIQSVLDALVERSRVDIVVERDPERFRPSDVPEVRGDPSRFRAATGWALEVPFEQTLADLLDHWRARLDDDAASDRPA